MQLPKYDSYKDSGVAWLGEIPEHWECDCIRAATTLKSEKNQPDLEVLSVYREYGVIPKDSRDDNHNATSLDTSAYKVVKPGDLVVNKMKAWQGSMGVSEHEGIVSPAYITCKTNQEDFHPKYLHYLLRSKTYVGVYNAISYGVRVGQWDLRYEDFKKITIPIPTKTEQERIVSFLDQKTAEINEAIAKKQKLIELLQEQKSILINQAVTKGLNPDAPMKDSGVEWIGEIPAHWEVKRLKYASKIFRGKFTHRPRNDQRLYDGEYPFIQTGDVARAGKFVTSFKQTLNEKGLRVSTLVPSGTVVITIAANIGDVAIIDFDACFPDSVVGFSPHSMMDRDFLYYSMTAMKNVFIRSTTKNTQMNLNVESVGSNQITIPPHEEQINIVSYIERILEEQSSLSLNYESQINLLQEYKQSLISSAVTGKIKV
ncbi:restriction endonuclease subunit S [Maridesulfovibrio bastinii]|uniref:restriction endonuclease subunit S n=1 Tax=Maridesulfovibrio bastinii TaxID=47157 RepID=UPI00042870E4|nr:restriction endonuclease subunit S [Maridesulfovibrio bastinii]